MSKLVDRLVVGGAIERSADLDDQRVRWLLPTALGRSVVSQVMGVRPQLDSGVLERLDDDELRHLALALGLQAVDRRLRGLEVQAMQQ